MQIVTLELNLLSGRLPEKGTSLCMTELVKEELANHGYGELYGACPLRRTIRRDILNPLAIQMPEGRFADGSEIEVDLEDGKFVFREVYFF